MNLATRLYRQIHPAWISTGGVPTSHAFKPKPMAARQISVADGDQITARQVWSDHVHRRGHRSAGTMAVTVKECDESGTTVRPDPKDGFPAHALGLFGKERLPSNKAVETAAKWLLLHARKRGWQFQPE